MQKEFYSDGNPREAVLFQGCAQCYAFPKPGQPPFRRCSGCSSPDGGVGVAYCSPECQKKNWTMHKKLCKRSQKQSAETAAMDMARDPFSLPALALRKRLLPQFISMYEFHINRAVHCAVKAHSGFDSFEYNTKYLQIDLRYRPGPRVSLNPPLAFEVVSGKIEQISSISPTSSLGELLKVDRELRIHTDNHDRTLFPNSYFGQLLVIFCMDEEYLLVHPLGIHMPAAMQPMFDAQPYDNWLRELTIVVHRGWVLRKLNETDDGWVLGVLVPSSGQKWVWKQISADELGALGLPHDFELLV